MKSGLISIDEDTVRSVLTRELAMLVVLRHCAKMRDYELEITARSEDTTPPPNW